LVAQAEQLAELREDRGRLTAENAALLAAQAKQEAQPAPAPVAATHNTRTSRLALLWPIVLGLAAIVLLHRVRLPHQGRTASVLQAPHPRSSSVR
jgi:hypothetical protein